MDRSKGKSYRQCDRNNEAKKFLQADGTVLEPSDVPGLVISVASIEMQPATSIDRFPTIVNTPTTHTNITSGKSAGLRG